MLPRKCSMCRYSLFVEPRGSKSSVGSEAVELSQYKEYLDLLIEPERSSVIAKIKDDSCSHYFHLLCLCFHRSFCVKVMGFLPGEKIPCPFHCCKATYDTWKSLSFLPYTQYLALYQAENPQWKWIYEFCEGQNLKKE